MINKKLLLFVLGLLITTQMIFSQVPSYVPTNGLVGYWPFSGNANDQTPNGNNGTVNGASLTTDRFGNANSAYDFDGLNSEIIVPNNPSLNLENPNQFTFSYWINVATLLPTGISFVIIKQTDSGLIQDGYNSGVEYLYSSSCRIQNGPSSSSLTFGSLANTIPTNSWIFVCQVWDGNHGKTYLNNILVNDVVGSAVAGDNLADLRFGKPNSSTGGRFDGKIDDIGIWNRALSQQEITNIYNGVTYSDTCNAVSGSLVNGLVGYWPFCGNANDQSGNDNNGVVNGATLTTDRFGNSNSAYSFDGVNDYISTSYSGILGTNSRSVSFWYNSFTNNTDETVFTDYGGANNCGEGFACTLFPSNEPGVDNTGSYIKSNSMTSVNNWNFYTVTYNSADSPFIYNCKLYINGILQSTSQSSTVCNINTINDINMVFGSSRLFNPVQYFNGKIDDIGIWNRALTQEEVTQLFNQNQCITNITVTDTLIINVGQLSYTNPIAYSNNITIAPNPASTQININFNNISDLNGGSVKIINSLGQEVATTPITTSGTNTTMSLDTWGGAGLYFVQILNAQGIVVDVKKIILQ